MGHNTLVLQRVLMDGLGGGGGVIIPWCCQGNHSDGL